MAGSYWHPCCLFDNPPRCVAQLEPVCLTLLPHRDGRCRYFLFEMPCGLPLFRVTLKCPGASAWWWHYAAMHVPSSRVPARHCARQHACPVVTWRLLRRLDLSSWGVVRQWVRWAAKQHACLPHIPCCLAVASHPRSSLQVWASFLTCAGIHASVAGWARPSCVPCRQSS